MATEPESPRALPAALAELPDIEREIERELDPVAAGRPLAAARALAMDRTIRSLLPSRPAPTGWALLAVGGYGRGELSPHSDVDLLMLTRQPDPAAEELARALFYGLWDAGVDLSAGVRTLSGALRLAEQDLAARTSGLQARLLAGDSALFDELARRSLADIRRSGGAPFLRGLLADARRRHESRPEVAFGLEPDIKEGRGGLRDAQALAWAGAALGGAGGLAALAPQGCLGAEEVAELERAVGVLLSVRHRLHRLAGRRVDRLYHAYQPEVAAALAYRDRDGHSAAEQLGRDLNAHAVAVARVSDGFWEWVEDEALGSGRRRVWPLRSAAASPAAGAPAEADALSDPAAALTVFAEAARQGRLPPHRLLRRLRAELPAAAGPRLWSEAARESFFAVLRSGERADALLEAMAGCGLLSLCLPEWEPIRHLVRHDIYHQHTVDRHSGLVVRELGKLAAGQGADALDREAAAGIGAPDDRDVLLLAGLLHDVGKGQPGDHSETGAAVAERVAGRLGLTGARGETLAFLVRHHLLLARTATRRDLDDAGVLRRLVEQVGSPARLRMLYLLTVADSVATGPSAWTTWKAELVRELCRRALRGFESGDGEGPAAGEALAPPPAALRAALAGLAPAEELDAFLTAMPAAYLSAQSPAAVREHFALLARAGATGVALALRRLPGGQREELTLAAADRPGLLWRVCGVFALHGVQVLEARAYTGEQGQVLDVFRLADAFEPAISPDKEAMVSRDLALALEGRLSLPYRLSRKLRHYRPAQPALCRPARVAVDNAASAEYTVVEVRACDRLGLLYAVSRCLSELQLDIHLAKVTTRGPEAIDVFYVRDRHRRKVLDPDHLGEIERAVLYELEESGAAGYQPSASATSCSTATFSGGTRGATEQAELRM